MLFPAELFPLGTNFEAAVARIGYAKIRDPRVCQAQEKMPK